MHVNTPWKIRLPSQTPGSCCLTVYALSLSLLKPWRNTPCRVDVCALFGWDVRLCWKPCFNGAASQSYTDTVSLAVVLSLAQIKLFPFFITDSLLIISGDTWIHLTIKDRKKCGLWDSGPHFTLLPPSPLRRLESPQSACDLTHPSVGDPKPSCAWIKRGEFKISDVNSSNESIFFITSATATKAANKHHACV